jgi:hypothetical protein
MNRIITGIIFFFLFPALAKAQVSVNVSQMQNFLDRNHLKMNEIKGTPYLNSEYENGTILSDAGILYKNVPLRYDCFNDILEFRRDNKTYCADPKESVKKAEFGGKVFVYKTFEKEGGTGNSYFEEVVTGKAALYARYSVNFHEAVPTDGFTDARPAQFGDLMETWYIGIDSLPARKIVNNKKFVEIFGNKKNEVEAYISKQKLSVKKKDDLKKIVTYYNSLFQ